MHRLLIALASMIALQVSADEALVNAHAVSPTVTLAGALSPAAADDLAARGIRTVIDLRTAEEGTADEQANLEARGFRYINFPTKGFPDPARRAEFAALMDDLADTPVLVHCASGNRAGMLWALYRADRGATPTTVMAEIEGIVTRTELRTRIAETIHAN